jgi:predicted amidohydrolase YtcJ
MKKTIVFLFLGFGLLTIACQPKEPPADLVLKNGEIYTMESDQPWARAVAITGNEITAVADDDETIDRFIGPETQVVDLQGKFVMPGYIDGHTHFDGYGAMQNDADLLAVSDDSALLKELERLVAILPKNEWITGGKWDAHRLWKADWREREELKKNRWHPDRNTVDPITPNHPCLLSSWDKDLYFANTLALKAAGLENATLQGMKLDDDGTPTGLLFAGSPAIEKIEAVIQPKSEKRVLNEMRAGLARLAEQGIVEIHDITDKGYPELYAKLQASGELTCRVWMRLDLSRSVEMKERGITMGVHPVSGQADQFLRYGAFKGYMDGLMGSHGALLREPYSDKPETSGHYRFQSSDDPPGYAKPNLEKIYQFMKTGVEGGYTIDTHAIGDKGIDLVLDAYERLAEETGKDKVARSRIIHAQTVHDEMFPRFKALGIVAEVTPSNVQDDMRWIIRRLGPEREKLSHRYGSFVKNGIVMNGGSDIPGAQGATFVSHPRSMIHAVVNRTQDDGTPEGGWYPEEKLTMHDAIKMYTLDAAYAVFAEDIRGSIKVGKLADFTICDLNLMKIDPADVLKMNIEMTIVDGKIVYESGSET